MRTDRAEMIRFIVDELGAVSKILPRTYTAKTDLGRPTAGAALALRARVLCFEASALCNPGHEAKPWEDAADAAWDVLELGVYSLYQDGYAKLFTEAAEHSSESIFNVEAVSNPLGLGHSMDIVMRQYNGAAPLGNFVDSYWMKDGKPREESSYADSENYDDLDPALRADDRLSRSDLDGRNREDRQYQRPIYQQTDRVYL